MVPFAPMLFTDEQFPSWRQYDHNARSAPSSSTDSSVILNVVKDLRLSLKNPFDPMRGDNRQAHSRTNRGLGPSRPGS
jgi:hypothetical protein